MKRSAALTLRWAPRILTLLFAAFISIFALDAFHEGAGFWANLGAFLIHLIPTYVLLLVLGFSWRRPWIGGAAGLLLGTAYIVFLWGRFPWLTYALIAGPLFLLGALFLAQWIKREGIRASLAGGRGV